jgi:lipoprotein-releasing system permease protein
MSFVTFVSGRYLKTRRKRAFISLITGLSVAGVTVGVMALIVVIAVMAGFELDLKSRIMGIRPHLVITKKEAPFTEFAQIQQKLASIEEIDSLSATMTTEVVLRTETRITGSKIKGIEADSPKNSIKGVNAHLLGEPEAEKMSTDIAKPVPGIILGKALAANLGVMRGDIIYMISPRGMLSPAGHMPSMVRFQVVDLFESGMYEFDGTLSFIHLTQAQKILRAPDSIGGIEIRLKNMELSKKVAFTIRERIGNAYVVKDWKQINQNLFSALRLEKTVMFIILTLIILVATFNIAGSLVMMVMEKRKDIAILKTMGATSVSISRIFIIKGLTIGLMGTVFGTSLGLLLCTLLERYSFISLPANVYYITTLPVNLKTSDIFLIGFSALFICFLATLFPARQAANIDPVEAIRHG